MRQLGIALLMMATAGCQTFDRQAETPPHASRIQQASYENGEAVATPRLNRLMSVPLHKRYDLYCTLFPETTTAFQDCRILGLTGVKDDDSGAFSKSLGPPRDWFDGMLVLEWPDGRLAYVPPGSVKYFEESSARLPEAISTNRPPAVDRFR